MTTAVLLTTTDCGFCEHAKEVLARVAGEFDLHVRVLLLDSPEGKELAKSTGAPFPPILFLNGAPFSYGRLSERKLRKVLR